MAATKQGNVKSGYDLAAEALYYIADKLSSTRNDDEQLRVNNELVKQGLDVNLEDLRAKARRLREYYQRRNIPPPPRGSREREDYILSEERMQSDVNSMKPLICFALGIYGNDLIQTKQDISIQVTLRKPSPEYVQAFLKMDDVERQLGIIQVAMKKDWCEK
jgi:hypothetical protein